MRANRGFFVLLVLGAALAGSLAWQRRETLDLREAVARERDRVAERDRLTAENRRLASIQPSDAEMEALVNRLTQVEQLKAQLATLRIREEAAAKSAQSTATRRTTPSLAAASMPVDRWQNVGQATAEAAFETALWAAAHGDLDALTNVLAFDAAARAEAAALFAKLPPAAQVEMVTPERMVAVLTAMDVPLGRAMIVRQEAGQEETSVTARLTDPAGRGTTATFSMKADGDRWQLQVPVTVVRKYAAAWGQK
jgi:hypothetical protein